MFVAYHLQALNAERDILGIEMPGELLTDGMASLLHNPSITLQFDIQQKMISPLSSVISIEKWKRATQNQPHDPDMRNIDTIVRQVGDTGYDCFILLR